MRRAGRGAGRAAPRGCAAARAVAGAGPRNGRITRERRGLARCASPRSTVNSRRRCHPTRARLSGSRRSRPAHAGRANGRCDRRPSSLSRRTPGRACAPPPAGQRRYGGGVVGAPRVGRARGSAEGAARRRVTGSVDPGAGAQRAGGAAAPGPSAHRAFGRRRHGAGTARPGGAPAEAHPGHPHRRALPTARLVGGQALASPAPVVVCPRSRTLPRCRARRRQAGQRLCHHGRPRGAAGLWYRHSGRCIGFGACRPGGASRHVATLRVPRAAPWRAGRTRYGCLGRRCAAAPLAASAFDRGRREREREPGAGCAACDGGRVGRSVCHRGGLPRRAPALVVKPAASAGACPPLDLSLAGAPIQRSKRGFSAMAGSRT